MKKNFMMGMFALAALAMTSCSMNDEISSAAKDQEVVFGTYVGRDAQTKAHVEDLAGLQKADHGFGVYAYYTKTAGYDATQSALNFMNNQGVMWDDTKGWHYTPVKYWPNNVGDKITFFAYAPYNAANVYVKPEQTHKGDPKLTFVVNSSVAAQEDLLYSKPDNINAEKPNVGERIGFNFAHALSRIGFTAQTTIDRKNTDNTAEVDDDNNNGEALTSGTTVAIQKVELLGNFHKQANLNLNGGVWSDCKDKNTSYVLTSTQFESVASSVSGTEAKLNNDEGYIMIIPQTFSGSEAVQIQVTYTVTTTDASLNGGNSVIENIITSDPFSFNFEQGKAYNFSLHLGLTSVQFSATVAGWDESPDDTAVNVPLNLN